MIRHIFSTFGTILLACLIIAKLGTPTVAEDFEDSVSATNHGNDATLLQLWRPLAEQGNAAAQHNMGIAYLNGYGVPKDEVEAERWFRLAAEQGYAPSQNTLGNRLRPKNPNETLDKVARARAAEAASWYRKAAEQGFARAQLSLGLMYEAGWGVPKDYVQALKWYSLAKSGFTDPKQRDPATINAYAVAVKMTPAQIAEAQSLASEWKPKPNN